MRMLLKKASCVGYVRELRDPDHRYEDYVIYIHYVGYYYYSSVFTDKVNSTHKILFNNV